MPVLASVVQPVDVSYLDSRQWQVCVATAQGSAHLAHVF